jgi:hypothetical protein
MSKLRETVASWCSAAALPEADAFFELFVGDDGLYISAEGPCWDFKSEWPFSLSDDYFGGIARLICAFANTHGGVVIFGVHDSKRTGGHNKVNINLDKFQIAIRQLLDFAPELILRSYESKDYGAIDVLLVPPRPKRARPLSFQKVIGKYQAGTLWVRRGHEVVEATPRDFPVLFCRAGNDHVDDGAGELDGSLPPNPATIKRFVGRVPVISRLFDWLQSSDEPRTYLHGKGGSGKSTIAFEFARLVKDYGVGLPVHGGDEIDSVIYLSAKEKLLVTAGGPFVDMTEPDFSSESELYQKILFYSRWMLDEQALVDLPLEDLKAEIVDLFNHSSMLLVIDDVDTLTTKGVDPGSEFLFKTLCRAKKTSKILYTLRNVPTQSIANSIEVPGLSGEDYDSFAVECANQFGVNEPTVEFRNGRLAVISERRPLVVESIVALVRTTGSYGRAADAFEQHDGEGVRDYVFLREWDALSGETPGRLLLAALSDLKSPIGFADLQTILQNDHSKVRDAIGSVREMFLTIDQAGEETLFSLAPLTKKFVSGKKDKLVGYNVLRERVKAFKRNIHVSSPDVARQVMLIERLLPPRYLDHQPIVAARAWGEISDASLKPSVTEDPLFRSLKGYVASSCRPARLTEAREAFKYAAQMGFEPEFKYLLAWFNAEKSSGAMDGWCEHVADLVMSGKRYTESEKISMISRRATSLYVRGRDLIHTDFSDAANMIQEALSLHLRAFKLNCNVGSRFADSSENYARNTAFTLLGNCLRHTEMWEVLDRLYSLVGQKDVFLDPIAGPLTDTFNEINRVVKRQDAVNRVRQKLRGLADAIGERSLWLESEQGRRIAEAVRSLDKSLAEGLKVRQNMLKA